MHKRGASACCRFAIRTYRRYERRSRGINRRSADFREPFCAVVVNFFYERQLLFRFGRNRKIQILNFMRLIGSPGFLKSLAHALL
jgi:hypothetical protein